MAQEAGDVARAGAADPIAAGVGAVAQREQEGLECEEEERRTHRATLDDAAAYGEGSTP